MVRLAAISGGTVVLFVAVMVGAAGLAELSLRADRRERASQSLTAASTSSRQSELAVPPITVKGNIPSSVSFSNWRVEGLKLVGVMQFNGRALFRAQYTIRQNGVVKDQGPVGMPDGDHRRGEPVEVYIVLGNVRTDNLDVEIEVLGAE